MKNENKNILICDDDPGVRESLRLILERDYNLFFARNGRDAVRRVESLRPDLLIMDVKMPLLNGLEALKKIRRANRTLPVFIISGYESSDVAVQVANAGANEYLTKPFHKDDVAEKVRSLLGIQRT